METLLIVVCVLLLLAIILIISFRPRSGDNMTVLLERIEALLSNQREGFRSIREENSTVAKDNRQELSSGLKDFSLEQRNKFDELKQEQKDLTTKTVAELEKITTKVEEKLAGLTDQAKEDGRQMRETLTQAFKDFQQVFSENVKSLMICNGRNSPS